MNNPAPQSQDLGITLFDSVAIDNFTDIGTDVGEAWLDSLTSFADTIEAVPGFGIAVKAYRAAKNISEQFQLRKIGRFLLQLQQVPLHERQNFVHQFDNDPKFKKKTGERLLIVLDRLDDERKADILGKLFRAYMTGQLDELLFGRFSGILERAFLPDLLRLKQVIGNTPADDAIIALDALGLVYQSVISGGGASGGGASQYSITSLGQRLVQLISS